MLVGRDRELGVLEEGIERLVAGHGGLFLLVGEPGIGKSRLATEALQRAQARGVRTAWGRCWEGGGAPTLSPWQDAFAELALALPPGASIAAPDPDEARFTLFREIARTLGDATAGGPIALALEDLHAADRASLLLLDFLAMQLRATPVLVVGTYRDVEVRLRDDIQDLVARLSRAGSTLALSRLRAPDVRVLVQGTLDDADEQLAARVYEATLGNPLFVDEILRDVAARGSHDELPIPLGVREIIRQRLALAPEPVRRALEAGAVLGVELDSACAGRMIPDAAAAFEEAARRGLVVRRGARVRFTHALYREALYHDLSIERRRSLHREAATAIAATSAALAEIAHHLLEGGPDAAVEAIDHAIGSADHAVATFAFEDAHALLLRAWAAIPAGPLESALRCRLLVALGELRIRSGDATGRDACLEAAALARTLDDPHLLALAGLAYGSVFLMGGVDPVLVSILEEADARLPAEDSALRARVMARLAAARQPSPPPERARDIELALDAIAMARRVADRRELLEVLQSASGALYGAADPAVRLPIAQQQERLADELGDTTRLLQARVRMALDTLELADIASYERIVASYAQLAEQIGKAAAPWRVPLMRSMIAILAGRFDEAARWQAEAAGIARDDVRACRARTFHRVGFLRAAERHDELRAAIPALRTAWLQMPYGHVIAEPRVASIHAHLGDADAVRATFERLHPTAFDEEINGVALADAVWLAGDAAQARRLIPILSRYVDRCWIYWFDCEIVEAPVGRGLSYMHGLTGDWETAQRLFDRALAVVEGLGRRGLAARMCFELGDLLVRSGRDPAHWLVDALKRARELGLVDLVALVERRHPAVAPRPAAASSSPPAFAMVLEGEYFAVPGTRGTLRFKANRGMRYLARLVEQPCVDLHVLDLAGAEHSDRAAGDELLDGAAFRAYRGRLEVLRDAALDAEARGDVDGAERARAEMEEIAGALARGTGLGGRARRATSTVERARSAVQRRIKDAIDRIAEQDAELGAVLRQRIHTGHLCSYRP